jgi:hypothetical protein
MNENVTPIWINSNSDLYQFVSDFEAGRISGYVLIAIGQEPRVNININPNAPYAKERLLSFTTEAHLSLHQEIIKEAWEKHIE